MFGNDGCSLVGCGGCVVGGSGSSEVNGGYYTWVRTHCHSPMQSATEDQTVKAEVAERSPFRTCLIKASQPWQRIGHVVSDTASAQPCALCLCGEDVAAMSTLLETAAEVIFRQRLRVAGTNTVPSRTWPNMPGVLHTKQGTLFMGDAM